MRNKTRDWRFVPAGRIAHGHEESQRDSASKPGVWTTPDVESQTNPKNPKGIPHLSPGLAQPRGRKCGEVYKPEGLVQFGRGCEGNRKVGNDAPCGTPSAFKSTCDPVPGVVSTPGWGAESLWDSDLRRNEFRAPITPRSAQARRAGCRRRGSSLFRPGYRCGRRRGHRSSRRWRGAL